MRDKTRLRPSPALIVAVLALAAGLSGAAVAQPVAKKAVTKKKVKRIADKEIGKLAPGLSVAHADSANSATNADKALSANSALSAKSALSANTAASVGGVSITPVSIALADTPTQVRTLLSVSGSSVRVTCTTPDGIQIFIERGPSSSPPITGQWIKDGVSPLVAHPAPGNGNAAGFLAALGFTGTIRQSSGRVSRLVIDAFREANAYGGPEDCFIQGTIERFG